MCIVESLVCKLASDWSSIQPVPQSQAGTNIFPIRQRLQVMLRWSLHPRHHHMIHLSHHLTASTRILSYYSSPSKYCRCLAGLILLCHTCVADVDPTSRASPHCTQHWCPFHCWFDGPQLERFSFKLRNMANAWRDCSKLINFVLIYSFHYKNSIIFKIL